MANKLGKWRRLQQCAASSGCFSVLAIDHRGPLRRALESSVEMMDGNSAAMEQTVVTVKRDIVGELAPLASAVLLDPETGLGPCMTGSNLPGSTGLLTALDSGSTGDPRTRAAGLVDHWSVGKAARIGASGVKLLLYYHPEASDAAQQEDLIQTVGLECVRCEIPFFLEPLAKAPDGSPLPGDKRRELVIEMARRLVPLGVDVLKTEFPLCVEHKPAEAAWREACEELSAICSVPWVLLSAGISFELFLRQVEVACESGASGVMVGRSVWDGAATADANARRRFLRKTGRDRMLQLRELCNARARPFTKVLPPPMPRENWHETYPA